ncbi:MAG TPA: VanZ family protein [Gemmatimonadaceae bacterium]
MSPARRAVPLALAVPAILVATLRPLPNPGPRAAQLPWCLACGATGGADLVRNVLLFLPLGLAVAYAGLRARAAITLGLALSVVVESLQLTVVTSRAPSVGDVLANTLGAAIGYGLLAAAPLWGRPSRALARRLAAAWLLLWAAAAMGAGWLLQRAPVPPGSTLMRLPPSSESFRPFEGIVERAELDGQLLGPGSAMDATRRAALSAPDLSAAAVVQPMYPPGLPRPLVYAFTPDWQPVVSLEQRGRSLRLRVRLNAARLHLLPVTYALDDAFPPRGAPVGERTDAVRVAARLERDAVRLASTWGGATRATVIGRSPQHAWMLLAKLPFSRQGAGPWITALWVALWALPAAYLGTRGRAAAVSALGSAAVLLLAPLAWHLAPPAPWEWAGLGIGLALGWLLARRSSRNGLVAARGVAQTTPS